MPTLDDLKKVLAGATVFSVVDLNKGYHQLELAEESRQISTFDTHIGLFRHKHLFLGAKSAAEEFQNTIQQRLAPITGSINMSDDILVFGKTQEEHDSSLLAVLDMIRDNNLTANKAKCKFGQSSVTYFGHTFLKEGVCPTGERVEALVNASPLETQSEVRSLLGLAQYISHFLAHFSSVVAPLRLLLRKDQPFEWGCDTAACLRDSEGASEGCENNELIPAYGRRHVRRKASFISGLDTTSSSFHDVLMLGCQNITSIPHHRDLA